MQQKFIYIGRTPIFVTKADIIETPYGNYLIFTPKERAEDPASRVGVYMTDAEELRKRGYVDNGNAAFALPEFMPHVLDTFRKNSYVTLPFFKPFYRIRTQDFRPGGVSLGELTEGDCLIALAEK